MSTARDPSVSGILHWLFADAAGQHIAPPRWIATQNGVEARIQALRDALTFHGGWALLARRAPLIDGQPLEVVVQATAQRRLAVVKQPSIENDLAMTSEAFAECDIAWACLKGPVLNAVYRKGGDHRP